jgi:predicted GTPase
MKLPDLLRAYRREVIAAALMLLPPLVLIPLGAYWLWEQGSGLWFFAVCLLGAMPTGFLILDRRAKPAPVDIDPEEDWPARETAAFEKVRELARAAEPFSLTDGGESALNLATRTVELVAGHYRAKAVKPMTDFTVPEGLLLLHRVSARLRRAVLDLVPLSDRLTLSQLITAYEYAERAWPLVSAGGKAYDAYRALRAVVNPAGAALAEARGYIFDRAFGAARSRSQRKLTELLVLEVGKAAIELYSGRLANDAAALDRVAGAMARGGTMAAEAPPLRILIAGQAKAGKSSLLNALARDVLALVSPLPGPSGFHAFEGSDPEGRRFIFVDAPGLAASDEAIRALGEEAQRADIVLWVVAAHQAARDTDVEGLKALRDWFTRHPERNRPPTLAVATHIDQLRPFAEWEPPYDIVRADRPKSRAIRDAVAAIAHDLALDPEDVVPVCLAPACGAYNLDALRARIAARLPEARYAQLARAHATPDGLNWWKEFERAREAGRALFGR